MIVVVLVEWIRMVCGYVLMIGMRMRLGLNSGFDREGRM